MIFEVSHKTFYSYSAPVVQSHHLTHLEPRAHERQRIFRHSLLIEPAPASRIRLRDYSGNPLSILVIEQSHTELLLHARTTIEVEAPATADLKKTSQWNDVAVALGRTESVQDLSVVQYICPSRWTPKLRDAANYAKPSFPVGRPVLEGVLDLTKRIHADFKYDPRATDATTEVQEVFKLGRGVCQDFAHLEIACLRALGLPARYVSGYLLTRPPEGQTKLAGADASHAWISAWAPETGWVDFDPTNNMIPGEEHITISAGRDFNDVSPISGVLLGGGEHSVDVAVDVTPAEAPPA
jgi:transglutaminase-like putative cysteine protease